MNTTCEIPQGEEVPNDQVNDDLPTSEAIKIADEVEIIDDKGEKHTFKSVYSGPESPDRVVVFFIRHFYCGSCSSYVRFLSEHATLEKLKAINTRIVIIGHGDPGQIEFYRQDTGCEFPIYTDPSEKLYTTLGMIQSWVDGPPSKYMPDSPFWVAYSSMKNAFFKTIWGYPLLKSGTINLQGGEFLFEGKGDEKIVKWCHRMRFARDHTDTDEILEVLGIKED